MNDFQDRSNEKQNLNRFGDTNGGHLNLSFANGLPEPAVSRNVAQPIDWLTIENFILQ
jgi:hypothetical protein